jgi:hypothetical protein
MRCLLLLVLAVACANTCVLSNAQESSPPAEEQPSEMSPDKKWEFSDGDTAKLVKAGTNEVALEFLEGCDLGALDEHSEILWASDSKRLAFYSCGAGKVHLTLLYQLRDDYWVALKTPGEDDQIDKRAADVIEAHAKRKGLPKGTFLHMQWWTVKPQGWLDSNTLIVYASMAEVVHRRDGEYVGPSYGADLLFTLKFDDAGNWKIIKTHEMTGKAAESPSLSSPLADKVLYRSPQGSYRIQASADGTALWIVSEKDRNRRKPLPGEDPDNRSPEEFSASPDESWLFDNRKPELYRDTANLAFAVFNKKQWLWKNALDYASKEFHFARREIGGESAGWSFDSARLLINFEANPPQQRFVYFNTRTKAFEQTPYLQMVNTKLQTEKPYEAFPSAQFAPPGRVARYMVFAEPIDAPPSEEILKPRFDALDHEMSTLREKVLADLAKRGDSSIVEFNRQENEKWNKARDEAVQLYAPFAPKDQRDARKLQFLCDVTQEEVNGLKEELKELAPANASDKPTAQSPSPAATPH